MGASTVVSVKRTAVVRQATPDRNGVAQASRIKRPGAMLAGRLGRQFKICYASSF